MRIRPEGLKPGVAQRAEAEGGALHAVPDDPHMSHG